MKVLILGATGLVGQSTLVQAVTHAAITQVIAPTRKPLPPSSMLANPVAERMELLLPEVLTWGVGRKARRVAFCRRTCSDAVPNTGASSSEKVPCQSRSEDRRRSSRQRHCCGPGLSLSLRRKFELVPWRNVHEIAFDADE